jgi:hypothetical protein
LTKKISGTFDIVRRVGHMHGCIFLLRAISILVTVLPNPELKCKIERMDYGLSAYQVMAGYKKTCFDVLFSGHAAAVTLYGGIWIYYEKRRWLKLLIVPFMIIGYLSLIATHFHYTVDVLYGFIFGTLIFCIYHYMLEEIYEKISSKRYMSMAERSSDKYFGNVGYYSNHNILVRAFVSYIIWHENWGHFTSGHILLKNYEDEVLDSLEKQ